MASPPAASVPASSPLASPNVSRTPFQPNSRGGGESSSVFDLLDTLADLASALSSSPRTKAAHLTAATAEAEVAVSEAKVTAPAAPAFASQAKSRVGMSFDTMNGLVFVGEQRSLRRPRAMSEPWSVDDNYAVMQLAALSTKAHITPLSPMSSLRKASITSSNDDEGADVDGGNSSEMLSQYSSKYNTFGRIGIYTREERAAIIKRFRERRSKRVWKKKIRYHCRKNLADRRVRVKGRFVKAGTGPADEGGSQDEAEPKSGVTPKSSKGSNSASSASSVTFSLLPTAASAQSNGDSHNDSSNPPAKRMRRHSIAY